MPTRCSPEPPQSVGGSGDNVKVAGIQTTKRCSACGEAKTLDAFAINRSEASGRQTYCRPCNSEYAKRRREDPEVRARLLENSRRCYERNRERFAAKARDDRLADPVKYAAIQRRSIIKRKYGLTDDDYDALVAAQNGECRICCCKPDRLHIDHDHETGQVRGLLCTQCNTALGLLKDSPLNLQRAIHYLLRPSVTTPVLGQEMEA